MAILTGVLLVVMYLAPVVGMALAVLISGALVYLGVLEVREWARKRVPLQARAAAVATSDVAA